MKPKIILYNNYHNGDLFYSRMLTKLLNKDFQIDYHHNMYKNLFEDDCNISELENLYKNEYQNCNNIYNTWIGFDNGKYLNPNKCSFGSYKKLYTHIYNSIYGQHDFDDYELLPTVDYKKLEKNEMILNQIEIIRNNFDKLILIANGRVLSGQSENFDFDLFLHKLCKQFNKYAFLLTNESSVEMPNLIKSNSLTKENNDLLYLSLISTKSDIIIGRASGPHCFTHVRENLLDENKTYISFTFDKSEGIWYDNHKCKQIWSNNFEINNVLDVIKKNIS